MRQLSACVASWSAAPPRPASLSRPISISPPSAAALQSQITRAAERTAIVEALACPCRAGDGRGPSAQAQSQPRSTARSALEDQTGSANRAIRKTDPSSVAAASRLPSEIVSLTLRVRRGSHYGHRPADRLRRRRPAWRTSPRKTEWVLVSNSCVNAQSNAATASCSTGAPVAPTVHRPKAEAIVAVNALLTAESECEQRMLLVEEVDREMAAPRGCVMCACVPG